jgi:hypothetical protein
MEWEAERETQRRINNGGGRGGEIWCVYTVLQTQATPIKNSYS